MLTTGGVQTVEVIPGSETASVIGQHWNAVKGFLGNGETDVLDTFSGLRIGFKRFATDPGWIERWGYAGDLDFEEIYEDGAR